MASVPDTFNSPFNSPQGIDGVLFGNIPGGGKSRSASLCINLILSMFDANGIEVEKPTQIVDLAQAVEKVYIGSPCGKLDNDKTMILFAKEGMGTYYDPAERSIKYVPMGKGATDFRIVVLDTGTDRPGLEKSTYAVRRRECEELVAILQKASHIKMAGIGLREQYRKCSSDFEVLCDITYMIPGVLGAGDKNASCALPRLRERRRQDYRRQQHHLLVTPRSTACCQCHLTMQRTVHTDKRTRTSEGVTGMKAKWRIVVEGESGGRSDVKWLLLVLAVIILMLILLGLDSQIVVNLR